MLPQFFHWASGMLKTLTLVSTMRVRAFARVSAVAFTVVHTAANCEGARVSGGSSKLPGFKIMSNGPTGQVLTRDTRRFIECPLGIVQFGNESLPVIFLFVQQGVVHLDLVVEVLNAKTDLAHCFLGVFTGERVPIRGHLLVVAFWVRQDHHARPRQVLPCFLIRVPHHDFDGVGGVFDETECQWRGLYNVKTWIHTGSKVLLMLLVLPFWFPK